jgi:TM2 domain-containing membrane protein YozV
MPTPAPQNYANHRSTDAVLIGVAVVFLLAALIGLAALVLQRPVWNGLAVALIGLGLLLLCLKIRQYALIVQDRVIRMEMRLRLERLLPPDLQLRIYQFSLDHLVALRFASDAELPALARRVLDENLHDRDAIKRLITDWQPDHHRI